MSVKEYLELNEKYWREAKAFLSKEDLVKASEKLWGAAAEIVKAVAAKRGINYRDPCQPLSVRLPAGQRSLWLGPSGSLSYSREPSHQLLRGLAY